MQDWMRKHRRLIMFFILVFICFPFVFMWGNPGRRRRDTHQSSEEVVVAQVGSVPIKESEFRRSLESAVASRRGQNGESPTYQELDADGTVQRIIENLVDAALIKIEEQQRNLSVDESLLVKLMQKWDMFKDEKGQFNYKAWNEWVGSVTRWDEIYDEMRGSVARQVFLATVTAPAGRVLEKDIQEELKANHTKIRVKYTKIEPEVNPTEEEIQEQYQANIETYRKPEQNQAMFLAIPLIPEVPPLAYDIIEKARQGEDFAELANTHSALSVPEGGEMGWRAEEEYIPPHLKPLFDLMVGEVSEPIWGPTGYFIYKNEQERTNQETGKREIFARQIMLNATIDESEKVARESKAEEAAVRLQAGEDPQLVAQDVGAVFGTTGFFDRTSEVIENISPTDVFQFRAQAISQKDTPWKPIKTRDHIFLTKIIETKPGEIPPLEEVYERVKSDVISARKRTEEYKNRVKEYAEKIKGSVTSLDQINTLFPELNVTVGETTDPFTAKDTLFQYQVYVQAQQIVEAFKGKSVGEIAGPLSGFFGDAWFFELLERTEPTEEELAGMAEEKKQIRDQKKQMAQYELLADYTKDLRERMLASVPFKQNNEVLDKILGRNQNVNQEVSASEEGESSGTSTTANEGDKEESEDTSTSGEAEQSTAVSDITGESSPMENSQEESSEGEANPSTNEQSEN